MTAFRKSPLIASVAFYCVFCSSLMDFKAQTHIVSSKCFKHGLCTHGGLFVCFCYYITSSLFLELYLICHLTHYKGENSLYLISVSAPGYTQGLPFPCSVMPICKMRSNYHIKSECFTHTHIYIENLLGFAVQK